MARTARSRVSISTSTPKKEADKDFKLETPRSTHNATRRQQYKRAKRAQQIHAVKADIKAATNSDSRNEAMARKGELYRTWKSRDEKKMAELERVVKAQQAEIEELKRLAQGGVPRLEPVATPKRGNGGEDVDSSSVKIEQQLTEDVVASLNAEEPKAVEQETTVATSIEKEVGYPTLPSVEAEEVAEAVVEASEELAEAAVKKSKKEVVRESSADTNAGTPRNVRRSPRKRTVKRKSVGGH